MKNSPLSDADKQVFLAATNRRKAAGIRLKRISFMAEAAQVEGFNELLDAWVVRWGKEKAIDHLISLMAHVEARIRERERHEARQS